MRNTNVEIECQVIQVISDCLSKDPLDIEPGSLLVEDLDADSMSIVEVIMMLNDAFGIELAKEAVGEWRTVADVLKSVDACR